MLISITAQNQTYYFQKMDYSWFMNTQRNRNPRRYTISTEENKIYKLILCRLDNLGRPKSWNFVSCCALIILVSNLNYSRNYNLMFGLLIDGILLRPYGFTNSWRWIKNWYFFENWDYYNYLYFKIDSCVADAQSLFDHIVIAVIHQSQGAKIESRLGKCYKLK